MKAQTGLLLGVLVGGLFWQISEGSVPKEANCSYLASPATDALAFAGGAFCAWRGLQLRDAGVAAFGSAVITIHTAQYLKHKTG